MLERKETGQDIKQSVTKGIIYTAVLKMVAQNNTDTACGGGVNYTWERVVYVTVLQNSPRSKLRAPGSKMVKLQNFHGLLR